MVIYKYPIPTGDPSFSLDLPSVHKLLSVQAQGVEVCIWAAVNPDTPMKPYRFRVVMTGEPMTPSEYVRLDFVGTFQRGWFVGHLFRVVEGGLDR